jgi:hypothetical protein
MTSNYIYYIGVPYKLPHRVCIDNMAHQNFETQLALRCLRAFCCFILFFIYTLTIHSHFLYLPTLFCLF